VVSSREVVMEVVREVVMEVGRAVLVVMAVVVAANKVAMVMANKVANKAANKVANKVDTVEVKHLKVGMAVASRLLEVIQEIKVELVHTVVKHPKVAMQEDMVVSNSNKIATVVVIVVAPVVVMVDLLVEVIKVEVTGIEWPFNDVCYTCLHYLSS